MSLDLGTHESSVKLDEVGERILGVIGAVERNKIFVLSGNNDGIVAIAVANNLEKTNTIPFRRWRVIALGLHWLAPSTANEDPVINFGHGGDSDAFGKMTAVITGGEKFQGGDHQKYDPLNLLAPEIIAETSASLIVTWTEGVEFNVWETSFKDIYFREAAGPAMSSGEVKPYAIVEVDTGGKW